MKPKSIYSSVLVSMQFLSLLVNSFPLMEAKQANLPGLSLLAIAVFIGLWAVTRFDFKSLSIFPEVKAQAKFIVVGPYKWIRHPMYLALVIWAVGSLMLSQNWIALLGLFMLLIVLVLKINWEENQLEATFTDYSSYKKGTSRLIPGIW